MKLYLQVTKDKYELPLAVAETGAELARMIGVNANTIHSTICKTNQVGDRRCSYVAVEVDDDE